VRAAELAWARPGPGREGLLLEATRSWTLRLRLVHSPKAIGLKHGDWQNTSRSVIFIPQFADGGRCRRPYVSECTFETDLPLLESPLG
jgi:hypothetical protein